MKKLVAEKVTFTGEVIDNRNPKFMELASTYQVTAAPTFIVLENNQEIFRAEEPYEVEDFLKKQGE